MTQYDPRHIEFVRYAHFISDLPHSKFHMPAWTSKDCTADHCGTAGCFGGWCATLDRQRRLPTEKSLSFPLINGRRDHIFFGDWIDGSWELISDRADKNAIAIRFNIPEAAAQYMTVYLCVLDGGGMYGPIPEWARSVGLSDQSYICRYGLVSVFQITPQMAAETALMVIEKIAPGIVAYVESLNLPPIKAPLESVV